MWIMVYQVCLVACFAMIVVDRVLTHVQLPQQSPQITCSPDHRHQLYESNLRRQCAAFDHALLTTVFGFGARQAICMQIRRNIVAFDVAVLFSDIFIKFSTLSHDFNDKESSRSSAIVQDCSDWDSFGTVAPYILLSSARAINKFLLWQRCK